MLMVHVFKQIPKYNAVRSQEISFCMYGLISTWREDFKGSHGYSVVVFRKHFFLPGSRFFRLPGSFQEMCTFLHRCKLHIL